MGQWLVACHFGAHHEATPTRLAPGVREVMAAVLLQCTIANQNDAHLLAKKLGQPAKTHNTVSDRSNDSTGVVAFSLTGAGPPTAQHPAAAMA
jgi:hypothetical protein